MNVRRELQRLRAPDEDGAQVRAWELVSSTYRARARRVHAVRRARRWTLALGPAAAAAVLAVALTPAGATVSRVISDAVAPPPAHPALSLPTSGKLLVSDAGGTWIVAPDGTRSKVGRWRDASWSPHARYVVVASRNRLAAVTQGGAVEWELSRPAVSDPSWYAPSGYRVAYRSGRSLRVVAGDGTGDHLLATEVSPVAPVWRPGHPYQLAYIRNGRVVLRGADSGRVFWTQPAESAIKLEWSANGSRLLLLTRREARVLSASGQTQTTIRLGGTNPLVGGSMSPDGRTLALVRQQGVQIAHLAAGVGAHGSVLSSLLPGTGIHDATWSPDSRWLLINWPTANEWVFVATGHKPYLKATSGIAQRFGQSAASRPSHRAAKMELPELDGWCCVAGNATPRRRRTGDTGRAVKASAAAARPLTWSQRLRASRRALIDQLAPLRRPQTAAERALARTLTPDDVPYYYINETIDRRLVRYATTTPWGDRIYLVPVAPWSSTRARRAGGSAHLPPVEGIVVYSRQSGVWASGTAARIRQGAAGSTWETIKHGVTRGEYSLDLVPDGVTKVSWVLPQQPGSAEHGWPTYPRVGHLTATVHGNVVAAESPRFGRTEVETWYAADGHIVRRVGGGAAAPPLVPVIGPGPETAKSRAAEQNPSTPNRRSVTPALGGQHTHFQPPTVVPPVSLPELPAKWTAWSARPAFLTPHGTEVETIVTSWGYRFSAPGPGPGNVIPPGGIMIDIMLLRSQAYRSHRVDLCSTAPVIAGHPRLTPPLTLPRTTAATSEGAPGVKEFRVFGRYRNYYNFEVRVNIDTRRPIGPRRTIAERVVSGLRFPTWPTRRIC